jgi:hypothetical protein
MRREGMWSPGVALSGDPPHPAMRYNLDIMATLSFPKSAFCDPTLSEIWKFHYEPGCDDDSRECIGYRDEPHQHLVVTGYYAPPEIREALKARWTELHPGEDAPPDDDLDDVIASKASVLEAGPWRYFHAGQQP